MIPRTLLAALRRGPQLRHLLVLLDLTVAAFAWRLAQLLNQRDRVATRTQELLLVAVIALVSVGLAGGSQLYRARVCSLRSVEIQRLARVMLGVGVLTVVLAPAFGWTSPVRLAVTGAVLAFTLVTATRGAFKAWMQGRRKAGRFLRKVVLVGANSQAAEITRLVQGHPEAGYDIVGVVGGSEADAEQLCCPNLGQLDDTVDAVRRSGANGVIIAATAWTAGELNELVRRLLDEDLHIHLATGMQGIAQSRLRPLPLAYEPLFYVESTNPSPLRLAMKRVLDVVVAATLLVVGLPILAIVALVIKLQDGGPVLFRQPRIGMGGRHFTMLKLRTMVVDAERRLDELVATQSGREGGLVKISGDPRITRIGRFLRASSIDELPQLLNVLGGSMSMVGPRPNLLVEAESLDPLFLAQKATVRPGITGLWQVEARDNPSFEEYRRYDIFYLENWTIGLDLAIMLATVSRVIGRGLRLCLGLPSATSAPGPATSGALE